MAAMAIVAISLPALAKSDGAANSYIVVFNSNVDKVANVVNEMAVLNGFLPSHKYGHTIKGFAAQLNDKQLLKIKTDFRVAFVSEDREVSIAKPPGGCDPWPSCKDDEDPDPDPVPTQEVPTGISRIGSPTSGNVGTGIGVAVIDTGIDMSHPDLAANVVTNKNCTHRRKPANDDNGHGTHVAGTIAALDNDQGVIGVAPEAKLLAVKVLNRDGVGTWSQVICGIDWVASVADQYNVKVANMSLSGPGISDNNCGLTNGDALHYAICQARDAGVTMVVAAGNEASDATYSVPASYDDAVITVSALADSDGLAGGLGDATYYGADDTFASFSNYGFSVDIAAPGVDVLSTVPGGGYDGTYSGTSMAAPHVTGAAALYHWANPGADWFDALSALQSMAEPLGAGHADPSGLHSEGVLNVAGL